jgi:pyrroloquinoline quinone biosynthesis protein B
MKVLILRGGRSRRQGQGGAADTAERGVTALGSGDGHWVLINVSAAVAHRLDVDGSTPGHPGLCAAGLRAVVLTDAQIEHAGGLLSLRGGGQIDLYATPAVFEDLTTTLPVLPVLQHYCGVYWHMVPVAGDRRVSSFSVDGMPALEFTAIATDGSTPLHSANHQHPVIGDTIALAVRDRSTGQRVFCAPGLSRFGAFEFDWMRQADCLLVDGQPAADDSEPDWVDRISRLPARHKVLFEDGTPLRREALAVRGIEMAYDGMEIEL